MVKLSEIQKPNNVAQFSNKKVYIKRFCANGTFIPSKDSFDNGEDNTLIVDEPIVDFDAEISTEELSEFEGLINHMIEVGNTYSRMFSINPEKVIAYKQFTVKLKDFIKDKTLPSRRIFLYRIKQVIGYINKTPAQKLGTTLPFAIQYLKEYLEMYITSSINNGINANVGMALGMNRFLPDRSTARMLQRVLRKVSTELGTTGTISKMTQKKLQIAYRSLFMNLIEGIESKIKDPLKRGMLDEVISGIQKSVDKMQGKETADAEEKESA